MKPFSLFQGQSGNVGAIDVYSTIVANQIHSFFEEPIVHQPFQVDQISRCITVFCTNNGTWAELGSLADSGTLAGSQAVYTQFTLIQLQYIFHYM